MGNIRLIKRLNPTGVPWGQWTGLARWELPVGSGRLSYRDVGPTQITHGRSRRVCIPELHRESAVARGPRAGSGRGELERVVVDEEEGGAIHDHGHGLHSIELLCWRWRLHNKNHPFCQGYPGVTAGHRKTPFPSPKIPDAPAFPSSRATIRRPKNPRPASRDGSRSGNSVPSARDRTS